jgi:manganese transport protein
MVPAVVAIAAWGEQSTTGLLILSQVVLSLQLPFAVYPLVRLTSDRRWMGPFANGLAVAALAWGLTIALISINLYLLVALVL